MLFIFLCCLLNPPITDAREICQTDTDGALAEIHYPFGINISLTCSCLGVVNLGGIRWIHSNNSLDDSDAGFEFYGNELKIIDLTQSREGMYSCELRSCTYECPSGRYIIRGMTNLSTTVLGLLELCGERLRHRGYGGDTFVVAVEGSSTNNLSFSCRIPNDTDSIYDIIIPVQDGFSLREHIVIHAPATLRPKTTSTKYQTLSMHRSNNIPLTLNNDSVSTKFAANTLPPVIHKLRKIIYLQLEKGVINKSDDLTKQSKGKIEYICESLASLVGCVGCKFKAQKLKGSHIPINQFGYPINRQTRQTDNAIERVIKTFFRESPFSVELTSGNNVLVIGESLKNKSSEDNSEWDMTQIVLVTIIVTLFVLLLIVLVLWFRHNRQLKDMSSELKAEEQTILAKLKSDETNVETDDLIIIKTETSRKNGFKDVGTSFQKITSLKVSANVEKSLNVCDKENGKSSEISHDSLATRAVVTSESPPYGNAPDLPNDPLNTSMVTRTSTTTVKERSRPTHLYEIPKSA